MSDEDFTRKHWAAAKAAGCAIVDLSYALESEPNIGIRSPWLDKELEPQIERSTKIDLETTAVAIAHPAAVMMGLLLVRAYAREPDADCHEWWCSSLSCSGRDAPRISGR